MTQPPRQSNQTALDPLLRALHGLLGADVVLAFSWRDDHTARIRSAWPQTPTSGGQFTEWPTTIAIARDLAISHGIQFELNTTRRLVSSALLSALPSAPRAAMVICADAAHDGVTSEGGVLAIWNTSAPAENDRAELVARATTFRPSLTMALASDAAAHERLAARFDAMMETTPQAIVFIDDDTGGVVNAAAGRLLGIPAGVADPAELAARMAELRARATNADALDTDARRLLLEPNTRIERWGWTFDTPERRHLRVDVVPVRTATSRGRLWAFDDLTREAEAERALRESESTARRVEARYRSALSAILDSFYILQPVKNAAGDVDDFMFVEANTAVASLLGLETDALIGATVRKISPTAVTSGLFDIWHEVLDTGEQFDGEYEPTDPRFRGMCLRLQVVRTGDCLAITSRDITEKKRSELAIRDSETKYRQLVEQAADPIVLATTGGRCIDVNDRACILLGRARHELVGSDVLSLFVSTEYDDDLLLHSLGVGDVVTAECWTVRADGTRIPVEISAGGVPGELVQVIARDISGRKQLERLKDEFLAMVSHELRTPLTSIRGALGLIAAGRLAAAPEKAQRMVDLAMLNADRLIRLINDILDAERIESGSVVMECEWSDAREAATLVADALRPIAERAGVELRVSGSSARVWADVDRLAQTLTNLVGNAIKFSPRGSGVEIRVEREAAGVRFEVRDKGRGIPKDKLESVFERFEQVDASDAREKGGTGLGLAICRSIVRQHRGRIWVESTLGIGSTFCVSLPMPPETHIADEPGIRRVG